ncbi:unnamed protein product, partial [Symbiodinium sp. CCMP2592]
MKQLVANWVAASPGPCLVLIRLAMTVPVRLMHKFLQLASDDWEKKQQLRAAQGKDRDYRLSVAYDGADVDRAFESLGQLFQEPITQLPLSARSNAIKVLAFRLFARLAGALHLLLRMPRAAFPFRLFGMLTSANPASTAEQLLQTPCCLLDDFSKGFLEQHSTAEALCAAVSKLEALALLCETDVVSIESRHAAARRLLVSRQQTWSYSFTDIAAEHLCRQFHKSQDDMFGAMKKDQKGNLRKKQQRKHKRRAKPPSGKKKGRKAKPDTADAEHRTGGAQRAFFHERLQTASADEWRNRSALFKRANDEFHRLPASEKARYRELGEAATHAGRHGGRRFALGVSGSAPRSRRAGALVPVAKHEQDALALIRSAEQRASNAKRLELAKARAAAVELREVQSQQSLETYGIIDGTDVFAKGSTDEPELTVEPGGGRIQVGQWCPPIGQVCKAALQGDKDAWSGRRFRLASQLAENWQERTMLQMDAKLPPDFSDASTTTLCQKHYMCVCGRASQSSEPEDAWFCHQKMIRLLRPFLTVKRKPKQTTPAGDPEAAPAPQTAKLSVEARKPALRKLLDKSFLVACLHGASAPAPAAAGAPLNKWAAAALGAEDSPQEEVWFHISYCNLQTWMFSFLRLEKMYADPIEDSIGNKVIRLKVPEDLCVQSSIQTFADLKLNRSWSMSFYVIDSTAKPIEDNYVTPNTVDVRLVPESDIPELRVWLGSDAERDARRLENSRKRKRQQSSSAPASKKAGHANVRRVAEHAAESVHTVPVEAMPGIDDAWSGDEEPEKEDDPNDALHELASFIGVAHGPAEASVAAAEPPPKLNNESASSSSLQRPVAAGSELGTSAAKDKAKPKAEANVGKKKLVKEDSILVVHDGILYGSLRYNSRSKTIIAICETDGHGGHGSCRKERTTAPSSKALIQGKSGRPIGFLVHWLLSGKEYKNSGEHVHSFTVSLHERQKARKLFLELEGGRAFSEKAEKAPEPGEPD